MHTVPLYNAAHLRVEVREARALLEHVRDGARVLEAGVLDLALEARGMTSHDITWRGIASRPIAYSRQAYPTSRSRRVA